MADSIPNHTKQKLARGEVTLGMGVRNARTVDIAPVAKTCGYDWLFIDMEHGAMDVDLAGQMSVTALGYGITPIVRTPGHQHFHSTRVLDAGAQGVVVPHVSTVAEARAVADNCRYPPMGHRSVAGGMAQLNFKSLPVADTTRILNDETLVVIMIETPEAVRDIEAIARVKGIDVLLIGTNDLCAEMGIHGQFAHKKVEDAYAKVIKAARKHGKYPGMGGVYEPELMKKYLGMGMQFILSGNDLSFMMAGAKQRADMLRAAAPKEA